MSMVKEGKIIYKVVLQSTQDDRVFEEKCIVVEDKSILQDIEEALIEYKRSNNKQR